MKKARNQNLSNIRILSQKYFVYKIRRTIPPYIRPRKSSVAIFIIRPEIRPVGLARFYITRHVLHPVLAKPVASQDVTKCVRGASPNCVAIAGPSHSSWRCTLHGTPPPPPPPSFFSRGLLRFVVAIERVWKLGGYFWRRSIFAGVVLLSRLLGIKREGGRGERGGELEEFFGKGSWILRGLEGERFNVFDKRGGISFWRGNWP